MAPLKGPYRCPCQSIDPCSTVAPLASPRLYCVKHKLACELVHIVLPSSMTSHAKPNLCCIRSRWVQGMYLGFALKLHTFESTGKDTVVPANVTSNCCIRRLQLVNFRGIEQGCTAIPADAIDQSQLIGRCLQAPQMVDADHLRSNQAEL